MARGLDELVQALIGAARFPQRKPGPRPATDALVQAAAQGGGRAMPPAGPAPAPWLAGRGPMAMRSGGINADDGMEYHAGADVLSQAARAHGHGLADAVLIGQGERGPGPNAAIEAREGTGAAQQTFQRGNVKYNVWFDAKGKRHVMAFHVGTGRRLH